MGTARDQQDLLCRVFGDCLAGDAIDLEVGNLREASGPVDPRLFTYLRYDVPLTSEGLSGIGCGHIDPQRVARLADVEILDELRDIGRAIGERRVDAEHLSRFLPTPTVPSRRRS